jgi:hypothetical protein
MLERMADWETKSTRLGAAHVPRGAPIQYSYRLTYCSQDRTAPRRASSRRTY